MDVLRLMGMFWKSSPWRRGFEGQSENVPNTIRLSYPDETPTIVN